MSNFIEIFAGQRSLGFFKKSKIASVTIDASSRCMHIRIGSDIGNLEKITMEFASQESLDISYNQIKSELF